MTKEYTFYWEVIEDARKEFYTAFIEEDHKTLKKLRKKYRQYLTEYYDFVVDGEDFERIIREKDFKSRKNILKEMAASGGITIEDFVKGKNAKYPPFEIRFPDKIKKIAVGFERIVNVFFSILMLTIGTMFFIQTITFRTAALDISKGFIYVCLPIFAIMTIIFLINQSLNR